jgi:dienelactone hydrolase
MVLRTAGRVAAVAWIASVSVLWSAGCAGTEAPIAEITGGAGMDAFQGTHAAAGTAAGTGGTIAVAGTGSNAGASGMSASSSGGAPASGGGSGGANGGASAGSGGAAGEAATVDAGAGSGAGGAAGPSFPSVSDLEGDGPYAAMTVEDSGPNANYTIYRPAELAPGGAKHPIIGWMSGGGSTPSQYELLPHLATHGFVVVASQTAPSFGGEVALGEEIIAGIDWMLAENGTTDSPYFGKLDETKIASMGFSMGALATTAIADDPRLTTTVHISGGNMQTDRVELLHAPAAFICGASGADIAGANCATDFEAATTPVFYGVFEGGDHLGVRTAPYSDRIRLVVTGWLRWQLMQDASLASMFVGDMCTVCQDPNWTVKQKGLQ